LKRSPAPKSAVTPLLPVTIQPGVVLGQLNRYLANFGRQFGPDPATGSVTTMGSVLALDNSGSNWLRYGSARQHIVSMQVVLAGGESFEAAKHPVTDDPNVIIYWLGDEKGD